MSIAVNMIVNTRLLHPPKRMHRAGCGMRIHTRPKKLVTMGVKTTNQTGKTVCPSTMAMANRMNPAYMGSLPGA